MLGKVEYFAACMVDEKTAAQVTNFLSTKAVWQSTWNGGKIMISGDTAARRQVVYLKRLLLL